MQYAGYHLLTLMYGNVTYVPRSEYANREVMLQHHAARIHADLPTEAKVIICTKHDTSPNGQLSLHCSALGAELHVTSQTASMLSLKAYWILHYMA